MLTYPAMGFLGQLKLIYIKNEAECMACSWHIINGRHYCCQQSGV